MNALLPGAVFISVISSLLGHELPLIRRKAMDLLNNRLPQTAFNETEVILQPDFLQEFSHYFNGSN